MGPVVNRIRLELINFLRKQCIGLVIVSPYSKNLVRLAFDFFNLLKDASGEKQRAELIGDVLQILDRECIFDVISLFEARDEPVDQHST